MRPLIIILLLCSFFAHSQSLRDSLIKKTWLNIFGQEFNFTDSGYVHGYGEFAPVTFRYEIKDSLINYAYTEHSKWYHTPFKYQKDSLTLFAKTIFWSLGCLKWQNRASQERYIFYTQEYINKKPDDFYKIQITFSEGSLLEVDSAGNIFYDAKGYGIDNLDYYGHYRGKLGKNKTSVLNQTIEREELKLKKLACRSAAGWRSHSSPTKINYYTTYANFPFSHYLDALRREGLRTFDFLLDSIDFKTLRFQKFADDDSVPGMVLYKPESSYWELIKCQPNYLTSYEDEGHTFHLYSATIDSVYYGSRAEISSYPFNRLYFYTDTLLAENTSILLEPHEASPYWFYRGRAFEKPGNLVFLKLEWFESFPEGFKLAAQPTPFYTRSMRSIEPILIPVSEDNGPFPNPFPKYYRTKFGLPYPFLRPDFQVAFERYILKDWEEYLKRMKAQN